MRNCREDSTGLTETGVNRMKLGDTVRQTDAMAVQRAFANTKKAQKSSIL